MSMVSVCHLDQAIGSSNKSYFQEVALSLTSLQLSIDCFRGREAKHIDEVHSTVSLTREQGLINSPNRLSYMKLSL